MPDQRSVMNEYRYLDEKRLSQGLTPAEQARLEKLRVLVGPETGAGGAAPKPGFDVNAAAAALRESLLPAGLRNRPPPTPVPPPAPVPAAAQPEPTEPALADALAAEYEQSPFAPLEAAPEPTRDALFDPASLGAEPPAYDASVQAAWDSWDANASAQGAAAPADAVYDPNAPQAWDPNQPYDPNAAYPADAAYDPNAPQAWDPNQPYDPNAAYPADAAYDPNTPQAWDPGQGWDAGAAPADGQAAPELGAYADAAYSAEAQPAQAWDASAETQPAQAWDGSAEAQPAEPAPGPGDGLADVEPLSAEPVTGDAAPPEGGSFTLGDLGAAEGWEAQPAQPPPPDAASFGAYDETGGGIEPFAPGTLGAEPPPDASGFDLDAGVASAPAAAPIEPAALAAPELGEYDDTVGFAAEPFDAATVPPGAPGLDAGPALELDAGWQPEQALEAGFELASGGSFAAVADAAAPEWAQSSAPPPWEGAPPLDLEAPPAHAGEELTEYEISPAPATETFGTAPGAASDLFAPAEGDLGAPEEPAAAELGAAPELDFSQPDFSGGEEPGSAPHDLGASLAAEPSDEEPLEFATTAPVEEPLDLAGAVSPEEPVDFAATAPPEEPVDFAATAPLDLSAAPPLDLEPPPPEPAAPAWEAAALPAEQPAEVAPPPAAEPPEQAAGEPEETILEASEVVEELEPAAPVPDVTGFAEAAAAAVAAESIDLSAVIAAAPAALGEAATVDEFSFDVAEEASAEPPAAAGKSFHAAVAIATATPVPGTRAAAAPPAPEPSTDVDLSFDLEEPPLPATLAPPPPAEVAAPVAPAEEEIPTIDGAEILEEIVEDVPGGAPPPQSLDFEPLEPEPAPAAPPPAIVAPPPPAPAVRAPPTAAAAAPEPAPPVPAAAPAVLAPPPAVLAPPPAPAVLAPPPPAAPAVLAPPPPAAIAAPPPAPAPEAEPVADYRVPGAHRVVVHTVEGLVKRGVLQDPELDAPSLALAPQAGTAEEAIATEKVKAIFFMLAPGEKAPSAEGRRVRVTFRDGRQIAGFSPDYREGGSGFFMIPADTKTNTGRIWVYRAAVRQVAVS